MLGVKTGSIVFVSPAGQGAKGIGTNAGIMGGTYVFPRADKIDCTDSIGWNDNPVTIGKQVFDFDLWNLDGILKPPCTLFEEECLHSTGTPTSQAYDLTGYMYNNCFIFSDQDKTPGKPIK